MKPSQFDYHAPRSTEEALLTIAELGGEARALAGGQSLVPMMNFRLAAPSHIVDLNRIKELSYIRNNEGVLHIGAMTRQSAVEDDERIRKQWPILNMAMSFVGHRAIRHRGTIGGSLAHADPAAELPAVMIALEAEFVLRRKDIRRVVNAQDFYLTFFTTVLEPDELLAEVIVKPINYRMGCSFLEVSRRHGDFALVGVVALLALDAQETVRDIRIAVTGAAPIPVRGTEVENSLRGQQFRPEIVKETSHLIANDLDPLSDLHASAQYRMQVAVVLTQRALAEAAERSRASTA